MCKRKCEVLLLDDEEDVLRVLAKQLEKRNCLVVSFLNPQEAALYLQERKPSVVIADKRLSGANGEEFLRDLPGNIGKILITGEFVSNEMKPIGGIIRLMKGATGDELRQAVETACRVSKARC